VWGGRAEGEGGGLDHSTSHSTPTPALRADPPHKGEGKEAQ
jgi:alpha-D-ribose 1-methylphosphonate 5-phosphate C-P lyase